MSICGEPEGKPTKYGVAIVDVCTGMLASNSILAALHARERTGKGQKVELSLYETSLAMLVNVAASYLAAGRNAGRFGNGHPSIVPYTTYQAADAMIALGVGNERQFARVAEVLGHPEWAKDARFTSNRARVENRSVLDALINAALSHDQADAWLGKLKTAGIPCGKINSVAEALDDPQTAARRMIETIEHPAAGALKMLGIPFKFSATACSVRRPPPTLGQHSEEILSGELGLDDKAIAELRRSKVV
jgi:crotonobetainyl-CoA:carnitine CoA-transferase CaiB-like acyl-CoA transferase